ncbi:MAG TPA: hypothetical protein PK297_14105 [Spirochaetota bacterium]|nr:hypothetical protein [Spirochaetota bacterium]
MTETMNPETTTLIERLVERENMNRAYKRVKANKGSAGVDGMTVDELKGWVHANWVRVKGELLVGRYRPQAVRGVLRFPRPVVGNDNWAYRRSWIG